LTSGWGDCQSRWCARGCRFSLAHQREDCLTEALTEFRSGKRIGYAGAMSETFVGIEPEALQDVAHCLAILPTPAP